MLVRIVLFLGVSLILLSGGAMGWQYWQGLQRADGPVAKADASGAAIAAPDGPFAALVQAAPPAGVAVPEQNWLISPGGGLSARDEVAAYLRQDGFVDRRVARIRAIMPVSALLERGEALPDAAFVQVFADIRAPKLALDLCRPLLEGWASGCVVEQAFAEKDSYDPATGMARFSFVLAYTQKEGDTPLPDLASHALHTGQTGASEDNGLIAGATLTDALGSLVDIAARSCPAPVQDAPTCRVTGLLLQWTPQAKASGYISHGWLAPLPKGMFPAPPLAPLAPAEG